MQKKTATLLFGVVTAAASTASANPAAAQHRYPPTLDAAIQRLLRAPIAIGAIQRPRIDATGDVACGNVMDKGAPGHVCTARIASPAPAAAPAPIAMPAAQPLLDADGDVLCGNVSRKDARHHICHTPDGHIVSDTKVRE